LPETLSVPTASDRSFTWSAVLFGTVVFLGAFLLFSVEPLIGKRILPWFGGSAAVWSTCLVFYQVALFAGYLYARVLTNYARPRIQAAVHIAILLASIALLPIGPGEHWRGTASGHPARTILVMLTVSIGLPFIALSSTSPLIQHWIARGGFATPYRLFAVSNIASLMSLVAYPAIVEPSLHTSTQRVIWSFVYVMFAGLCGWAAWTARTSVEQSPERKEFVWISPFRKALWFGLATCGSMLLLSVTNHINENVAAVPLLWVLPLAVYLFTFILSFGSRVYSRAVWLRLLAVALGVMAYAIYNVNAVEAIQVSLPILLAGLFICCMFCHGELSRLRPDPSALTSFYLMISLGGAVGAVVIGLVAPAIFSGVYELPISLSFTAILAVALVWSSGNWPIRGLWVAVAGCMVAVVVANVRAYNASAISLRRSFYGSLRVVQSPRAGPEQTRTLFHGTIEHGAEFLWPKLRDHATTYYGPDSGIGIVLREAFSGPKHVGLVGLGVGTLAAYGTPGDSFRFYEINDQVVDMAESLFFYLRDTRATIHVVQGDGRLSIERDTSGPFDVLALDAFSGDAIPVHLLTREAMSLYLNHLKPEGVIAFHVSNDFLDLAPVVQQLASAFGENAILVRNHEDADDLILPADWGWPLPGVGSPW
jgi:hypothetical protein